MVKLSKCKEFVKEYKQFTILALVALLGLGAVASSIHHLITIISVFFLVAVCVYFLVK